MIIVPNEFSSVLKKNLERNTLTAVINADSFALNKIAV